MDGDILYQKLLNDSFRFVSYRPRSEKEIRDFLEKKLKRKKIFVNPTVIEKVIARLRELNYLNDEKFVQWWINERVTHRPKGKRAVMLELRAKGISKELLENTPSFPSEEELAQRALVKKLKLFSRLSTLERKKKIYGFLGRQGFSAETIGHIIDEISQSEV